MPQPTKPSVSPAVKKSTAKKAATRDTSQAAAGKSAASAAVGKKAVTKKAAVKSARKAPAKVVAKPAARSAPKSVSKSTSKPALKLPPKAAGKGASKATVAKPKAAKAPRAPRLDDPVEVLTRIAVHALEDLKGLDIRKLDVRPMTALTDTLLVCTGTSNRHTKSLADNVVEQAKKSGFRPHSVQGAEAGEWIIVDLGSVVVHVMQAQARAYYQLEKLWSLAPVAGMEAVS